MQKTLLQYIFCLLLLFSSVGKGVVYAQTQEEEITMASSQDSVRLSSKNKGFLGQPAFSIARDSIVEDFSNGKNIIYYYGDVKVTYGDMELKAEYMEYDIINETVYASGVTDSLGVVNGKPEMKDGNKVYSMDEVLYNFTTSKAKIKNMVTKEMDGILHGRDLKMMPDNSINILGGKYTVCDHPHPHYYLNMSAVKVVTDPKQKIVFGPANIVLADVPLPIGIPFGFVPQIPERASGILFPTYGEEASRGFYLRDFGYYFALGDHLDFSFTGDFYTKGSWAARLTSRYMVKYKYTGSIDLSYSNDVLGEKGEPDYMKMGNFSVRWSHSQDSKARPGTTFRASVNLSTPTNNKYHPDSFEQIMQNQISSSISYSKTWEKMSLSINGLHSQNSRDSSYVFTLPNLTFNVNRFYPFKRKLSVGKERFYEKIAIGYNTTFQNKIQFKSDEFGEPGFLNNMQNGMVHSFSITLPSFTLLNYFNFTPSVSYGMNWYFQTQEKKYNPQTNEVETIMSDQFSTFGISQTTSASLSMDTRIYGTLNFKPGSRINAIRHMISPSVSMRFMPELGTPLNGYTTYTYTDVEGNEKTLEYNKYAGGLNSPPGKGKAASINFSLNNNFEAKILDKNDTTGTGLKKVKLLDQLNFRGSYNFLADSLKLSTIGVTMNTKLFDKISVSGNLNLDPYAVDAEGKRHNVFNLVQEGGFNLFRLTNASASMSWNISGNSKGSGIDGHSGAKASQQSTGNSPLAAPVSDYTRVYYHPITNEYIPGGWVYYLNPNLDWSLGLSYSYSYSKSYQYANNELNKKHSHTQTLGINGQLRLTKDLNLSVNTGLDMMKMRLTTTQLNATYDLHCFQISVQWIPSGQWSSWSFRIQANAAALADLLQFKKNSSYWDN